MSKAVSPDEVETFHKLYAKYGSYAEVARRTGRSASTVGRYIRKDKIPKALKHASERALLK